MKVNLLAIFCITALMNNTHAQYYNKGNYGTNKSVTVYTTKYTEHTLGFENFIRQHQLGLLEKKGTLSQTQFVFTCNTTFEFRIDSLLNTMGYITASSLNRTNIEEKRKNFLSQIETQRINIENEEFRISQIRSDTQNNKTVGNEKSFMQIENNIRRFQQKIKEMEKQIDELDALKDLIAVEVFIKDEISTPNGNDQNITWVNMPGFSYSYLHIENPKLGLTHEAYAGFNLKYLFTRGKSYVEIGVLKPLNPYNEQQLSDPALQSTKNDFFMVQFGQDFYTRHFGRGRRKYMNLYSGYTAGILIPNRYDDGFQYPSAVSSLNIGLELFKSKHVLIDTRAAYFLPLNSENRNTRGILLNAAFNFVF
jgi:hypothetical protein